MISVEQTAVRPPRRCRNPGGENRLPQARTRVLEGATSCCGQEMLSRVTFDSFSEKCAARPLTSLFAAGWSRSGTNRLGGRSAAGWLRGTGLRSRSRTLRRTGLRSTGLRSRSAAFRLRHAALHSFHALSCRTPQVQFRQPQLRQAQPTLLAARSWFTNGGRSSAFRLAWLGRRSAALGRARLRRGGGTFGRTTVVVLQQIKQAGIRRVGGHADEHQGSSQ